MDPGLVRPMPKSDWVPLDMKLHLYSKMVNLTIVISNEEDSRENTIQTYEQIAAVGNEDLDSTDTNSKLFSEVFRWNLREPS